ncbi:MAG: Hsp20/alpha crystallin family protein [Bacillota bacterium]
MPLEEILSNPISEYKDSFLNDFFGKGRQSHKRQNCPPVNIYETNQDYTLQVFAPGLKKEDFGIHIGENSIEVSVDKKKEEKNLKHKEFSYDCLNRKFKLPENVHTDNISAKYEDGLLKIVLPKKKVVDENKKTIPVK